MSKNYPTGRYYLKPRERGSVAVYTLMAATVGVVSLGAYAGLTETTHSYKKQPRIATTTHATSTIERRIQETKQTVVDQIRKCESAGYSEKDAPIVMDANGKRSYGVMQWQVQSVQHYHKKFHGEKLTRREAIVLALDAERAERLAHKTIWQEVGGVWNWENCAKQTGVDGTIETIRNIEKD